jgi:methyl-accepting chemotaxis protein
MKDILRMVYGDQKEVKLESQKIELASLNDLRSYINDFNNSFKFIESAGNDLAKKLSEASKIKYIFKKEINNVISLSSNAKKSISEFNKKVKDLGINISDFKEIKELESKIQDASEYLKFYTSIGDIPDI